MCPPSTLELINQINKKKTGYYSSDSLSFCCQKLFVWAYDDCCKMFVSMIRTYGSWMKLDMGFEIWRELMLSKKIEYMECR